VPCVYMTRVVKEAAKELGDAVIYEKVITKTLEGANQYKKIIKHNKKLVPVPSIIINGELAFKTIPGKEELVEFLNTFIHKQKG
jgi:hypothetical protein